MTSGPFKRTPAGGLGGGGRTVGKTVARRPKTSRGKVHEQARAPRHEKHMYVMKLEACVVCSELAEAGQEQNTNYVRRRFGTLPNSPVASAVAAEAAACALYPAHNQVRTIWRACFSVRPICGKRSVAQLLLYVSWFWYRTPGGRTPCQDGARFSGKEA